MRGLVPMIIAGATFASIMACQGCVQSNAQFYAATDRASPVLTAHQLASPPRAAVSHEFTALIENAETVPDSTISVAKIETPALTHPVSLSFSNPLNSGRLYSSDALTSLASDREQINLSPVPRETRLVAAEIAVSTPAAIGGLELELGIAPRISIAREGALETQRFGGEVRIGQNFDKRGELDPDSGWYLFAGADGEALVWEPDDTGTVSINDMALRDKVTVGDMQAGVSFQRGQGQLSLSYIRREVEYRERNLGASEHEDFAGISFTLRR